MFPWDRPLTNIDINHIISQTSLHSVFRGAFSRDELKIIRPRAGIEAGIINLSRSDEDGTHWTAWFKHRRYVCYYDSFGDLPPPPEFVVYLSTYDIYYNIEREQDFNTVICGQLCLCFLLREYSEICI